MQLRSRPIDETIDDSSSEAPEDPPSPPPNYGRRNPTSEEQREEDLLAEPTRVQATIAATTTQTMTKVVMNEPGLVLQWLAFFALVENKIK
jgi:hypothetical protein